MVAISAGGIFSLALKSDGTVVEWGAFTDTQLKLPDGLTNVVAISAGSVHAAALKSDGTIVTWGVNTWGQLDVPPGLTNVVAVSAGDQTTMVLKSDGTVVIWGANSSLPSANNTKILAVPAGLKNVTAISAQYENAVVQKSDGTIVAWGSNFSGQTNIPAGMTSIRGFSAGGVVTAYLVNRLPSIAVTDIKVTRVDASTVTLSFNLLNSGKAQAKNVKIASLKFGSITIKPASTYTIAAGSRQYVETTFLASSLAPGSKINLVISGTYTGGTFNSGKTITLP